MQSLGLQNIPSRTLESPQNETEAQCLDRLMTQEVYGTDPQRAAAFLYQTTALLILVAAYEFRIGALLWVVVLPIVGGLVVKGAKSAAPNAVRTVLKARKFPILYLRPFSADSETDSSPIPFLGPRTPERRLVALFRNRLRCPVVAVADPSEDLGSVGALRVWVNHDVWQDKVREFIRCAPLVLLKVEESSGLLTLTRESGALWELQQSIELMDPRRLLILLPKKNREGLDATLNRYLPRPIEKLWRKARLLAFDADWNPIAVDNPRGVLARYHPVRKVSDAPMDCRGGFGIIDDLAGPRLPEWRRVINIFVDPMKTFVDIERGNWRWWPPFLLFVAGFVCLTSEIGKRTEWFGLTGDETGYAQFLIFFIGPIMNLLWICVAALVLKWTVNRLFGGAAAWSAVVAVWMYASLSLTLILLIGAATTHWLPNSAFDLAQLPPTFPLGLSGRAGAGQLVLLAVLPLLHVWFVVLLSLGVAKIADVSRMKGFISVLGWDVFFFAWYLALLIASHGGSSPSQ